MTAVATIDYAAPAELERAFRRKAWPHGWPDLAWVSLSDKRDAIRIYARQGLHPIAVHGIRRDGRCTCGRADCQAVGKHPVQPRWQREPFDLEALDRMLLDQPDLNVGLRTGKQPDGTKLVVLDVDGPRSLLDPLETELGKLPPTLTAKTRRGSHLFFRVRAGVEIRNRVRLAPGVDVRAEGGQVVAPPSVHASGFLYSWLDVREPGVLP